MKQYIFFSILSIFCLAFSSNLWANNITIKSSIKKALKKYPEISQAESLYKSDKLRHRLAIFELTPEVSISYGFGNSFVENSSVDTSGTTAESSSPASKKRAAESYALNLSYNLFGGGELNELSRANNQKKLSKYKLYRIKEAVSLATTESFINIVKYQELKNIYTRSKKYHKSILAKSKKRIRAGIGRGSDIYLTKSRLADATSNLIAVTTHLEVSKNLFRKFTGTRVKQKLEIPTFPKASLPKNFKAAWQIAKKSNPSLLSKQHETKIKKADYRDALLDYYPNVDVNYRRSYDYDVGSLDGKNKNETIFLNLNYDINFLTIATKASFAKYAYKSDVHGYELSKNNVYHNLYNLFLAYNQNHKRLDTLENSIKYAERLVSSYNKEYRIGKRTLFDLLNVKVDYYNSLVAFADVRYEQYLNSYRILASIGKLNSFFGI